MDYYIASCVFTSRFPALSFKIQDYIARRGGLEIVRCCVPKYKLKEFAEQLPEESRGPWEKLPDSGDFGAGDHVYSLCHNCTAITEEWRPKAKTHSLWEWILQDERFSYPDYHGASMVVQDCWRTFDKKAEQDAVRELLHKMNISIIEQEECREKVNFCGNSLYREAPVRNLRLAPKRFVECASGKFQPHSLDEQKQLMTEYASKFGDKQVVSYCHYCLEGLLLGGANAHHLAKLLFEPDILL